MGSQHFTISWGRNFVGNKFEKCVINIECIYIHVRLTGCNFKLRHIEAPAGFAYFYLYLIVRWTKII